jgi:hypothetical protein
MSNQNKPKSIMIKNIGLVLAGIVGATAVPSIASTAGEYVSNSNANPIALTPGQVEFIRQFDVATGKNFSGLAATPGASTIIKSASVACGNVEFQKQFAISAGGNKKQAQYASDKFENLFCQNKI